MGMHLAVNGYFWNRPFNGSGQYTRRLLGQLATMVSDLRISLIVPLEPGEAAPADVPDGINLITVPIRTGYLGKLLFEQRGFPRAVRDSAHIACDGAEESTSMPASRPIDSSGLPTASHSCASAGCRTRCRSRATATRCGWATRP